MIDITAPDYANTPASDRRPFFHYVPRDCREPLVSIITPYYNTGPVFQETVRSIERMSFAHWEWLIVDDGSTDAASLAQLERLQEAEPRVCVLHQRNRGPGAARNRAARQARGGYLLQLDSDDLIEPTFVEQALWVLETQPQFAVCNSRTVTIGTKNYLWPFGFNEYQRCVTTNWVTNQAVMRRAAYVEAGGYDERIVTGHEDWDFWLNLAEAGLWGYTLPEYLTWYRVQERSRRVETEGDQERERAFRAWLQEKHRGLAERFPQPRWVPSLDLPDAQVMDEIPFSNPLMKPEHLTRVLLVVPWLVVGGADKFNLELVELLSKQGYEFTIATTRRSENAWLHRFSALTSDIFCLHQFLHYSDYPRFLNYLIDSRQIDAVLISNSELGYTLVPYLRAYHPNLAILDYLHSETEHWKNGGYPGMAVRVGRQLDLNVTNTDHLKKWIVAKGIDPERIRICSCGIDTTQWNKDHYDTAATRRRLGIDPETPLLLFVGRIAPEKRPLVFAKIIQGLASQEPNFVTLVIGDGEELDSLKNFVHNQKLEHHIRFIGTLPIEQVRELMAAGDILLLPSEYEGLALVLLECMAMETVPVAAEVGGHAELVTPECGYLIPHGDQEIAAYVAALVHLLHDPQERQFMAQRAREKVATHFGLTTLAEGMRAAIHQARAFARMRPSEIKDLEVVRCATHTVIEKVRLEELADLLWAERTNIKTWRDARQLRQRVLPIGTKRYELYKKFRLALRRVTRQISKLSDRANADLKPRLIQRTRGKGRELARVGTAAQQDDLTPASKAQ